jgi:hypothetical protein
MTQLKKSKKQVQVTREDFNYYMRNGNPTKHPITGLDEPTNYDWELDNLLEDYGFERTWIEDFDYLIYTHPKTKMRVELNNLNLKDCYSIFPFGDSEYYDKGRKGSLVNVDTLHEVKQILAKQKISK